jgi:hypothetical protein
MVKDITNINAQIKLLDDPDKMIFEIVKENLLNQGNGIIPVLEKEWESTLSQLVQERIEDIIKRIQLKSLCKELFKWVFSENQDIIEGAYIIAKHQYPELDYKDVNLKIETIKNDIWLELNDKLTAFEKIKILNHILFDEYKFVSEEKNIYSAKHTYLNTLLETKKGNPISILILYAGIAQKLDLPVFPVNLPMNYILAFKDELFLIDDMPKDDISSVLFYINPHDKGALFGKLEIDHFLKQREIQPVDSYYVPSDNLSLIISLINHLIFIHEKAGYLNKSDELKELLNIAKFEK